MQPRRESRAIALRPLHRKGRALTRLPTGLASGPAVRSLVKTLCAEFCKWVHNSQKYFRFDKTGLPPLFHSQAANPSPMLEPESVPYVITQASRSQPC